MFKKLFIKIISICDQEVEIRITEQSHRGEEFNNTLDNDEYERFVSYDDILLSSCDWPEWDSYSLEYPTLFTRGEVVYGDTNSVTIPRDIFSKVLSAVLEYNQKFNKNKLELSDVVENLKLWEDKDV